MNTWTVFKSFLTKKLRDRCKFYSSLKDECISEKVYLRAINVSNTSKRKAMGDYYDLYLKTNVLLLADVFEKFIDMGLKYYGLDPCQYVSSPGLSCDAMPKMTGVELELKSDIDMHLFTEKGIRGGISYIAKRFSKTNNLMMLMNRVNLLCIWIKIIYTVGQ